MPDVEGADRVAKGPGVLREINEKRILSFLRTNKTSSRQEMAEVLQVSKNTISLIIDKFIKEGVVQEIGFDQSGVGRPRMQLSLVPQAYQSAGILIRDTHCELVVSDYYGGILEARQLLMDSRNVSSCLKNISKLCEELTEQYPALLGIGVAVPGLVDPLSGVVHYSSHLGWREVPIVEILRERVSVPIAVLNRVKAAALSPVKIIPDDATSTFYIRIDEGVGGAFVLGNDIVHGISRTAGEIGHVVVNPEGPLCKCGRCGCLESLVSVPAVLRLLGEYDLDLGVSVDEKLATLLQAMSSVGSSHPQLERTMVNTGTYVGTAVATIVNLFNPQYVVVDSPYNALDTFKRATIAAAEHRALPYPFKHTHFVFVQTSLSSARGMAIAMILHFESANPS